MIRVNKIQDFMDWAVISVAALSISCAFVVRGSATFTLILLALLGLLLLVFSTKARVIFNECVKNYGVWLVSMMALPVAMLVRYFLPNGGHASELDAISRMLLAIPVFVLFAFLKRDVTVYLKYAAVAALVLMLFFGWLNMPNLPPWEEGRIRTEFVNTIPFSLFSLVFFAFFFLLPSVRAGWGENILRFVAAFSLASILFLSKSRGVWLCVPFVLFAIGGFKFSLKNVVLFVMGFVCIFCLLFYLSDTFHFRIMQSYDESVRFFSGDFSATSVGARWMMYKAAVLMFISSPLYGVGLDISPAMHALVSNGTVSGVVGGFADSHNEFLFRIASMGIIGGGAYAIFYICGIFFYFKIYRSSSAHLRRIGKTGLVMYVVLFVAGLTNVNMTLAMYVSLFTIMQSALVASVFRHGFYLNNG